MSPRRTIALLAGSAVLLASYGGSYGYARAAHLLVRESSACDPDRIVPGAGAGPAVGVVFAPLAEVEEVYWCIRWAWL